MDSASRRRWLKIGGAISAGAALGMGMAPARAQGKLTPVRFTCGANLGYANIFVADSAGIFRKYGIEPQVILFDVGFLGTEAVLAGQAETSTTVAFPMIAGSTIHKARATSAGWRPMIVRSMYCRPWKTSPGRASSCADTRACAWC